MFYFYYAVRDKCINLECYNGGTCYTDNYGNAKCKCTTDYDGIYCQDSNFF